MGTAVSKLLKPEKSTQLVCTRPEFSKLVSLTIIVGTDGIIQKIRNRVGTEHPVYLSIDIDTLDPACKLSFNQHSSPVFHYC